MAKVTIQADQSKASSKISGPSHCFRSKKIHGRCMTCGRNLRVAHVSLISAGLGVTCAACCRHCGPPAVQS